MNNYTEEQIYILVDKNTHQYCLPYLLNDLLERYGWRIPNAHIFTIAAGEEYKTIDTVVSLWHALVQNNATRRSLLINLGGGVVTDLGGFVASTYRRGIDYINVPTTLLSMIDAGFGGKTGFDFDGLKNEIGTFYPPKDTWIIPYFLRTLPREEILSGYAELIKHTLLSSQKAFDDALSKIDLFIHLDSANDDNLSTCERIIWDSIRVKQQIVAIDPIENNIRKSLNFGHTIGHALEELSLAKGNPMRHGYAVMYGLLIELYLSSKLMGLDNMVMEKVAKIISKYYGDLQYSIDDMGVIFEFMINDKKNNTINEINFTLLSAIGCYKVNQIVSKEQIEQSLILLNK